MPAVTAPDALRRILREHTRIAVVGLSPRPERPSHRVSAYMAEHGLDRCIKVDHARLIG
jgi:predicted CoA-binding protein